MLVVGRGSLVRYSAHIWAITTKRFTTEMGDIDVYDTGKRAAAYAAVDELVKVRWIVFTLYLGGGGGRVTYTRLVLVQ